MDNHDDFVRKEQLHHEFKDFYKTLFQVSVPLAALVGFLIVAGVNWTLGGRMDDMSKRMDEASKRTDDMSKRMDDLGKQVQALRDDNKDLKSDLSKTREEILQAVAKGRR